MISIFMREVPKASQSGEVVSSFLALQQITIDMVVNYCEYAPLDA